MGSYAGYAAPLHRPQAVILCLTSTVLPNTDETGLIYCNCTRFLGRHRSLVLAATL